MTSQDQIERIHSLIQPSSLPVAPGHSMINMLFFRNQLPDGTSAARCGSPSNACSFQRSRTPCGGWTGGTLCTGWGRVDREGGKPPMSSLPQNGEEIHRNRNLDQFIKDPDLREVWCLRLTNLHIFGPPPHQGARPSPPWIFWLKRTATSTCGT